MRLRLRFRFIAIVSLILASTIAILAMKSASVETGWQEAARSAPPGLMQQVIRENLSSDFTGDAGRMKVWRIVQSGQSKPLFLVDTRSMNEASHPHENPLCGAMGCKFLGYVSTTKDRYQQVFANYLKPQLPPKVPLIEPTPKIQSGLPTLKINQLEGRQVKQSVLAFNGKEYEVVETQLLPKMYE
ncbi:hypothetical protein ACQ4M3_30735 [Leptolyngbya sp. AN03gr2]|uniref:hypothetical protein n=1 Tax=unclassified Leptolyngbya TaxID=2650499 RepID=UPI003D3233BC